MTPTDRDQCCCKVADPRDCFVARHPEAQARFDSSLLNRPWNCELCECECHHGEADDEYDDDSEGCYHCGGKRYVITCPAEPVEAKEPWKPGMRVLVEAELAWVDSCGGAAVILDHHQPSYGSTQVIRSVSSTVPLSQLRPLPVTQEEGVGK